MQQTFMERVKSTVSSFWDETVLGNTPDVGKQPATVEAANEAVSAYGLHNVLRYDQYDEENGLFYNEGAIAFSFEVLAQTGADEEMASRLGTLFTPIPAGFGVQWCLFGSPLLDQQYEAYLDKRKIAVDRKETSPFFTELAQRRIDHIRRNPGQPLFANDNFMVKNIRLLISVTKAGSPSDRRLVEDMVELRETVQASLRTAGLPAQQLTADGLIDFLWPILNPECLFSTELRAQTTYDGSKPLKEQLTEFGHHARIKPNEILFGLPPETEEEVDSRVSMRSFGVLRYPAKQELWEMANIIGSFFDDGLQYPCPFVITGGVFTLDRNKVDSKVQLKAVRTAGNAKSKMAEFQPELATQAQDWKIAQAHIGTGGSLCEMYHTLLLIAPNKQMSRASQIALNIWRNQRFTIAPLKLLHLAGLYSTLPMTLTQNMRDDMKKLRLISTKLTGNAVDTAPIIGEWKGAGAPVMLFFGRRGSPTFLDFYANQQGNYNCFVAGVSGSGKSVMLNEMCSAYRGTGARVWVIDVGRSYQNLIRLQKGTFIEFTPFAKNPLCINPFSWVGTDNEIDFKSEMRLLKPMIGRMASPNAPLTEFQYSLITEAIVQVWKDYGPDSNPTLIRDHLQSQIKNEQGGVERVAYELAKQLQPFTKDGVYGEFFNGKANLSLDGDMIGLELEELKNAPELRRVVLFVLTSRIAHDMYLSRDRQKICLVDEAWQLLGDDKETAEFIEEGYRRARKYNGIFALGTQGIEDAFKNPASQAAYNNADWKIFLRQDKKNLEKLIEDGKVSFTPAIKRMLLSLRTERGRFSEMLVSSPNGDSVVRHIPDPFSLLMASTNAQDFTECEELLRAGHSTMEALTIMLRRRGQYD